MHYTPAKNAAVWTTGLLCFLPGSLDAQPPRPTRTPLLRAVELDVGHSQTVELADGTKATVKLLELDEMRDSLRGAVRQAVVTVEVNGERAKLISATYRLPQTVGGVQIDCPVTKGYQSNAHRDDIWGLSKDARLRLWPAGSPWIAPETFAYPVKQKWFASDTQMANEPVYVDGGEIPASRRIYYHYGLDIGGAEGLVEVTAAAGGLVVSAGEAVLPGYKETPARPRYDVVYLLDDRGWYYRYSHLQTIDEAIKPGREVKIGQKVGVLGKEGGSGGWSHLHFDIFSRQPSGKWGVQEGYPFLWQAYLSEHKPKIIAVARPHQFAAVGEKVTLDASRSWSAAGEIARFEWTLSDGTAAAGSTLVRQYDAPGTYSEIVKVSDKEGSVAYDFAAVQIVDKARPNVLPPTIHAVYAPTSGIRPGKEITFKVRTFRSVGGETWDFGDGSPEVQTKSDGNAVKLAKDGYAVTRHAYKSPGHYIVLVRHTANNGLTATTHLHVHVEK